MTKKFKNIILDKRIIIVLFVFVISLFIIHFLLKKVVVLNDNNLPIDAYFENKLPTKELIKFQLNDSTFFLTLDSNERKELSVTYRNGLNRILILLSNSNLLISDTLTINTRNPGQISIEIDKPNDELRTIWKVDSSNIKNYYFYKSRIKEQKEKRIKFAVWGHYID